MKVNILSVTQCFPHKKLFKNYLKWLMCVFPGEIDAQIWLGWNGLVMWTFIGALISSSWRVNWRKSVCEVSQPREELGEAGWVLSGLIGLEPGLKLVICLFSSVTLSNKFLFCVCFSWFHVSLLSFLSKRVLIDTATLINYSCSKPVWSCCNPLECVAILQDD